MNGTGVEPKRPGRWTRVALVVSLGVNLAVAGLVLGAVLRHDGPGDRGRGGHEMSLRPPPELRELGPLPFIMALEPDQRVALLSAAEARAPALRQSREMLRERFEETLRLLRTEPFDAEGLRTLLAEQRAAASARQEVGEALLVAAFTRMTPEARAAYADRLDGSLKRGPRKP